MITLNVPYLRSLKLGNKQEESLLKITKNRKNKEISRLRIKGSLIPFDVKLVDIYTFLFLYLEDFREKLTKAGVASDEEFYVPAPNGSRYSFTFDNEEELILSVGNWVELFNHVDELRYTFYRLADYKINRSRNSQNPILTGDALTYFVKEFVQAFDPTKITYSALKEALIEMLDIDVEDYA